MGKALSLAKLSKSPNCCRLKSQLNNLLKYPCWSPTWAHPGEAMIASVEDSSHPITILHLELYFLLQQQHLHHPDVTSDQHPQLA